MKNGACQIVAPAQNTGRGAYPPEPTRSTTSMFSVISAPEVSPSTCGLRPDTRQSIQKPPSSQNCAVLVSRFSASTTKSTKKPVLRRAGPRPFPVSLDEGARRKGLQTVPEIFLDAAELVAHGDKIS